MFINFVVLAVLACSGPSFANTSSLSAGDTALRAVEVQAREMIQGRIPPNADSTLVFSWSLAFGECSGYCKRSMLVTHSTIVFEKSPWHADARYPAVHKTVVMDPAAYAQLVAAAKTDVFRALPERIGCPDCTDGGAESIEISQARMPGGKGFKHRVTFEHHSLRGVEGIKTLQSLLSAMAEGFEAEQPEKIGSVSLPSNVPVEVSEKALDLLKKAVRDQPGYQLGFDSREQAQRAALGPIFFGTSVGCTSVRDYKPEQDPASLITPIQGAVQLVLADGQVRSNIEYAYDETGEWRLGAMGPDRKIGEKLRPELGFCQDHFCFVLHVSAIRLSFIARTTPNGLELSPTRMQLEPYWGLKETDIKPAREVFSMLAPKMAPFCVSRPGPPSGPRLPAID